MLLQNATATLLQNATSLLQNESGFLLLNVAVITKCDFYYCDSTVTEAVL